MSNLTDQELVDLMHNAALERVAALRRRDYATAKAWKYRARELGAIIMERVKEGTWGIHEEFTA